MEDKIRQYVENEFNNLAENKFNSKKTKKLAKNRVMKNSLKVYNKYINKGYSENKALDLTLSWNKKYSLRSNIFMVKNTIYFSGGMKIYATTFITLLIIMAILFMVDDDIIVFLSAFLLFILANIILLTKDYSKDKLYKIIVNSRFIYFIPIALIFYLFNHKNLIFMGGVFLLPIEVLFIQIYILFNKNKAC
ncbi:hypothetical protein [Gemella sp. zg-1178]|uniref:hypothetical protein n=1 Tax=Gemella sp. zg-1178 TaxID=2840372 RepID=UPI001C0583BA|nr:hypothetical protein [Gemella sp. zg-1178]MBU0278227.1 hypothetical protein [Gemella sp. zg-1178]